MCAGNSQIPSQAALGNRQPPAGRTTVFAFTAELIYEAGKTVAQYGRRLGLSTSTVKRLLTYLRRTGVVHGRLPSLGFDLSLLAKPPLEFCSAVVGVESDLARLKELSRSRTPKAYCTEEELLLWLSNQLARTDSHKGKIIVERGRILMGSAEFTMLLTVHAVSTTALFEFVRRAVETSDAVHRAHTMMSAFAFELVSG